MQAYLVSDTSDQVLPTTAPEANQTLPPLLHETPPRVLPYPLPTPVVSTEPQSPTADTVQQRIDKIVVVDDDARIRELLQHYLTQAGYTVLAAEDATALRRILTYEIVDVIVLDLMMPGEDGLAICQRLRLSGNKTPIIMLTAKDEDNDRVNGLELGADDYLGKPFNPRELLARIHALLRRRPVREPPGAPSPEGSERVTFGPFLIDMSVRKLYRDGHALPLSTGEFAMLKALVRNARQPLSRAKLAQLSRDRPFEQYKRGLDVQISRLRKFIEPEPAKPRYIQTVWGLGYVFIPDGAHHGQNHG